jgi:hypothetical protein
MTIYAFPSGHDPKTGRQEAGMNLRDYFAAKAMQALIWNQDLDLDSKEDVAEVAYKYADVMITERSK